ncbi:Growth-regulating factor 1, partial [Linum perenne]
EEFRPPSSQNKQSIRLTVHLISSPFKNTHNKMLTATNRSTPSSSSYSPFTATQWQELEHQALIYKYMVSGLPVPPQLLSSLRWGYFGKKRADPEPGRCRRTDGKKWRCSKEAYPDSKYCERHMHRGKNRSRKHVELSASYAQSVLANVNLVNKASSSLNDRGQTLLINPYNLSFADSAVPAAAVAVVGGGGGSGSQLHPGFEKDFSMQNQQLPSSTTSKGYYCSQQPEFETFSYPSKQQDNYQQNFVLGTNEFKSSTSSMRPIAKVESTSTSTSCTSYNHETLKPLHQFFGIGGADSWLDLASSSRPSQ